MSIAVRMKHDDMPAVGVAMINNEKFEQANRKIFNTNFNRLLPAVSLFGNCIAVIEFSNAL